jgi:hypothetical protein
VILLQKVDKQGCGDTLITVGKGVVFDDKIEQVGDLLLDVGAQPYTAKALIYPGDASLGKR